MARRFRNMSPFARAWCGIFLTTLAAVTLDAVLITAAYETSKSTDFAISGFYSGGALVALVAIAAIAFGAMICAGIVSRRPLCRTLPMFFFLVAAAGLLSGLVVVLVAPAPIVVIPAMVMGAQLLAAGVALSVKKKTWPVGVANTNMCRTCGYSLVGLDRTTSPVCPECGGPIG